MLNKRLANWTGKDSLKFIGMVWAITAGLSVVAGGIYWLVQKWADITEKVQETWKKVCKK